MRENIFPDGIWPVMLTPFTEDNQVDYLALSELVEWYIKNGVDGLFAVCQSSEMFALSLEERVEVAARVKEYAAGRVPVVASGHVSDDLQEQIRELSLIAGTGVDALILITNRMAGPEDSDDVWISNAQRILAALPAEVKLGLYECPQPYKRIMTEKVTRWCVSTERFYFLKDTSCDLRSIRMKLRICNGSNLKLYNANAATLLASMQEGACGYCGIMANMHPQLYRLLYDNYKYRDITPLSEFLAIAALIENHCYPVNAKYYLIREGLHMTLHSRVKAVDTLTEAFREEIRMLQDLTHRVQREIEEEGGWICQEKKASL